MFGAHTNTFTDKVNNVDLGTLEGVGNFAGNQLAQSGTAAALNKLMGRDASFRDALQGALYNTLAAAAFNAVGNFTEDKWVDGSPQKVAIHAIVGGLLSEATGGDFKTGAIAAGANEALVVQLDALVKNDPNLLTMSSQLVGLVAAAAVDGDIEKGAWVAQNATQYNFLGHQELDDLEEEARRCQAQGNCEAIQKKFRELSVANDDAISSLCSSNPALCTQYYGDLLHDRNSLQERLAGLYFDDNIPSLFKDDLHRYQMQNSSATGVLTQAGSRLELESKGVSPEKAGWGADLLAAMGGFLGNKGGVSRTPVFTTNKEARVAAEGLGFKRVAETVHGGQLVYKKGNLYITRDLDGHNGGAWKMATSIKDLSSKGTRMGHMIKILIA